MKSEYLKDIKKVNESKRKKILFINPKRRDCKSIVPHNGLAILAGILKERGHEALIVDYQLIHDAPDISTFLRGFNPDIIGVSLYTPSFFEAKKIMEKINKIDGSIPLVVGGPHATLYSDLLQEEKEIDYIAVGEAELIIIDIVEKAKKEKKAKIIKSEECLNLDDIPFPNYKSFFKWEVIRSYPIMTTRGCPYRCSFCIVSSFSKKWRARKPENCIKELEFAKKELSENLNVIIQDDNPLVDKKRFYDFLDQYREKIGMRFSLINTRADNIDDKLVKTLKADGCESICVAVESASSEVFKLINKGETLEQIEQAARVIKENNVPLLFCFVIGLPGDNPKRAQESIKFINRFNPEAVYWNMAIPFRNTMVREWYEKNGRIIGEIGKTSFVEGDFVCSEPAVETPDFTVHERKRVYYLGILRTIDGRLKLRKIIRILKISLEFGLFLEFLKWLPHGIIKSVRLKTDLINKGRLYYKREGFEQLLRRVYYLVSAKRL